MTFRDPRWPDSSLAGPMQQTVYARIAAYERQTRRKGGAVSVRRSKTLIDILKDTLRSLAVFLFNQVGVCMLLISYNVIGAFSFRTLEGINGDASVEDRAGKSFWNYFNQRGTAWKICKNYTTWGVLLAYFLFVFFLSFLFIF